MALQASRSSPSRRLSLSQMDRESSRCSATSAVGTMAGETFDDDANLLYVGFDVVGGHETIVRVVRQGLRGHGSSPFGAAGSGRRPAGNMYPGWQRREGVVAETQAASGQRSRVRLVVSAFGVNTRVC